MPVNSKSVRAGIAAMLVTRTEIPGSPEVKDRQGPGDLEVLLTRSGYIVVAG